MINDKKVNKQFKYFLIKFWLFLNKNIYESIY